jgi:hypothetical protein
MKETSKDRPYRKVPRDRLYSIRVGDSDWYEVGSVSDGMCGSIEYENSETGATVTYHWSVDHPTRSRSQEQARADALFDLIGEVGHA